ILGTPPPPAGAHDLRRAGRSAQRRASEGKPWDPLYGYSPRIRCASATRVTPTTYAARRMSIFRSWCTAYTDWNARSISSFSFAFTSFSLQKYSCSAWTHSKYDTVTPPAFARTSGITNVP